MVMEDVTFSALIARLATGALISLGLLEDPMEKKKKKDLELAQYAIDTLSMLSEKTKGNLNKEEESYLKNIISELKTNFVRVKEEK